MILTWKQGFFWNAQYSHFKFLKPEHSTQSTLWILLLHWRQVLSAEPAVSWGRNTHFCFFWEGGLGWWEEDEGEREDDNWWWWETMTVISRLDKTSPTYLPGVFRVPPSPRPPDPTSLLSSEEGTEGGTAGTTDESTAPHWDSEHWLVSYLTEEKWTYWEFTAAFFG